MIYVKREYPVLLYDHAEGKLMTKKNDERYFSHCHAHWLHNCRIFLMIALAALYTPLVPSAYPCHKQTPKREDR